MKAVRQHGTRAMYVAEKCRCDSCRAANRKYQQQRMQKQAAIASQVVSEVVPAPQVWTTPSGEKKVRHYKRACPGINGKPCKTHSHLRKDSTGGVCSNCREKLRTLKLLPAGRTRNHILELSAKGVGEEAVHQASGVASCIIRDIRQGKQKNVLPDTQRRILSVGIEAALPHALVNAKPLWTKIGTLRLESGWTKAGIAKALGYKSPALQFKKKKVMAKSFRKLAEVEGDLLDVCDNCGLSHTPADRQKRIKRMLPCTPPEIRRAYPCTYPVFFAKTGGYLDNKSEAADRMLWRDLNALGAVSVDGEWSIPAKPAPSTGEGSVEELSAPNT